MAPQGLTQAELDSLSVSAEDNAAPSSPSDEQLLRIKKNKRRITFSAIHAEISAVSEGGPSGKQLPMQGLSQEELDALSVEGPSATFDEPTSPLDSSLLRVKRRRSVSDGAAGAFARASELASERIAGAAFGAVAPRQMVNDGLSQAVLDELSTPAADADHSDDEEEEDSMFLRKRRQRAFLAHTPQSVPSELAENQANQDAICSTPPRKQEAYSTPPRNHGENGEETKVALFKTPDSTVQGTPYKSPESGKSADSSMQRSPLGSINREI